MIGLNCVKTVYFLKYTDKFANNSTISNEHLKEHLKLAVFNASPDESSQEKDECVVPVCFGSPVHRQQLLCDFFQGLGMFWHDNWCRCYDCQIEMQQDHQHLVFQHLVTLHQP